ncbi:protein of unknown function [Pararobbsia alpina]
MYECGVTVMTDRAHVCSATGTIAAVGALQRFAPKNVPAAPGENAEAVRIFFAQGKYMGKDFCPPAVIRHRRVTDAQWLW